MKRLYLSLVMATSCAFLCNCEAPNANLENQNNVDYISKLKNHIEITNNSAKLSFDMAQTRSQNGISYKITAQRSSLDTTIISFLFIDKLNSGYLFEHYTEDKILIASMQCDNNFILEDVYIPEYTETRGFRFWWACTQIEYYKTKQQQTGMIMDICNDWLPMSTINGVLSGLYCMGIK